MINVNVPQTALDYVSLQNIIDVVSDSTDIYQEYHGALIVSDNAVAGLAEYLLETCVPEEKDMTGEQRLTLMKAIRDYANDVKPTLAEWLFSVADEEQESYNLENAR